MTGPEYWRPRVHMKIPTLLAIPFPLYCIVLYLQPVLNPKSYDGARVLEASGRPMLVIGRSYWVVPIQDEDMKTDAGMKLAEEITEKSLATGEREGDTGAGTEAEKEREAKAEAETEDEVGGVEAETGALTTEKGALTAGTKLMA